MERILTVEQMKHADKFTMERLGISHDELVLRAGKVVAEEIKKRFFGGRVLVCIGKGNNGEDGKVVANILSKIHGFSVMTVNVSNGIFKIFDKPFDIIVDCIFGTGLNKEVTGKYKTAIEKINNSGAYVVSCDIPSGLNGDIGLPEGISVKANLTIAIQEYKTGHFLNQGKEYCGEVISKDIGISVWEEDFIYRLTNEDAKSLFPKRNKTSHKGTYGKVCILGGSKSYSGSVILSTLAISALKMGVGYSTLAIPNCIYNIVALHYPEITYSILDSDENNLVFSKQTKDKIDQLMTYSSIAVGMGMGVNQNNYKILSYILDNYKGNLLLDADALNTISKFGVDILKNKKCKVVITPHVAEMERLTGIDKTEIIKNTIDCAKNFANKYNVVVLLKNSVSVITDGKQVILNTTGNSGLAKGGSGDVLSGIIAGLLARVDNVLEASAVGSYILGKAAEKSVKDINEYSLTATDVVNGIIQVVNDLTK